MATGKERHFDEGEGLMTDQGPVDSRFDGFPGMVLGGYLAGRLASLVGPEAEVRLLRPTPSGRPLRLERTESGARALVDGEVVAEARPASVVVEPPPAPTLEEAIAASADFTGHRQHPFPECYVCGPKRAVGDGMRVFPGPLAGGFLAAPWIPRAAHCDGFGQATLESIWSALDCPGLWALCHAEGTARGRYVVTGTLSTRVLAPVPCDEPQIITAWKTSESGRKLTAGVAIFSRQGALRVVGTQVAVLAPRGVPLHWVFWR
jgi:hypothetical protein